MPILHIDSSITGEGSVSRQLSAAVVARLSAGQDDATVDYRDLVAEPVAHLTLDKMGGPDTNPDLAQFLAADTIVIGAAMYNFTVPSQLKAWIDRLLIPGQTFRYTATGPEPLIHGKRLFLAVARGGHYGPGSGAEAYEHVETYLRHIFGFIGVTDVTAFVAEGVALGDEAKAASLQAALAKVEASEMF